MYHIFAKTPIVQQAQQFGKGGEAYSKGDKVTYRGKPATIHEWMRLRTGGKLSMSYRLKMADGKITDWINGDKLKPVATKMAGGGEAKSDAKSKASAMLSSVFATPEKCSDAGATLATDSLPKKKKSPAGRRLGSLKCKVPARRKRSALSGAGKGYSKKK